MCTGSKGHAGGCERGWVVVTPTRQRNHACTDALMPVKMLNKTLQVHKCFAHNGSKTERPSLRTQTISRYTRANTRPYSQSEEQNVQKEKDERPGPSQLHAVADIVCECT